MQAKEILKRHNIRIRKAGHWITPSGRLVPVVLMQFPDDTAFTIGGDRRRIGRTIKHFTRDIQARH